jgi:DNA-binding FadR family transcriptional regulator
MAKKDLFSKPIKKRTMAEQMADTIKELILSGELKAGESLPTEPELSEQFEVSRAVVRDATRILMALGLVEVRHGSGVYVSESQADAFGEALLIALRRAGASAWDVEQFLQILIPEAVALAASAATEGEVISLREKVHLHGLAVFHHHNQVFAGEELDLEAEKAMLADGREITRMLFEATHNKLFVQLAEPLMSLRNLRHWEDSPEDTPELLARVEMLHYLYLVEAIETREPAQAREMAQSLLRLPQEAVEAMMATPVGERPEIPMSISALVKALGVEIEEGEEDDEGEGEV